MHTHLLNISKRPTLSLTTTMRRLLNHSTFKRKSQINPAPANMGSTSTPSVPSETPKSETPISPASPVSHTSYGTSSVPDASRLTMDTKSWEEDLISSSARASDHSWTTGGNPALQHRR